MAEHKKMEAPARVWTRVSDGPVTAGFRVQFFNNQGGFVDFGTEVAEPAEGSGDVWAKGWEGFFGAADDIAPGTADRYLWVKPEAPGMVSVSYA